MKTKKRKFETYLPGFSGFYDTIWSPDYEQELYDERELMNRVESLLNSNVDTSKEHNLIKIKKYDYDEIQNNLINNFDNNGYEMHVVKEFSNALKNEVSFITNITIQKIIHPKEYNFYTDSANIEITIKKKELRKWIKDNYSKLAELIKRDYTSRDGFISYYSSDIEFWKRETDDFNDYDCNGHYLGRLIDYYLSIEEIDTLDLYYDCDIETYNYYDYDKLINDIKENGLDGTLELEFKYIDPNQINMFE